MTAVKQLKDYYYEEMKSHSQFKNLEHFNEYTRKLHYYFKDKLNNTDYALIDYLAKHAVKAATGVACPKVMTIAKAIDRSVDTVGRIIRKLESLGIIRRLYNMRVKRGGNGANFYIFQKNAIPTLKNISTEASIQGRDVVENIDNSKAKKDKYNCKTNINLKLKKKKIEKNNPSNLSIYKELLDYKKIGMSLIHVYGTKRANKLWQRIIWAFRNSELYEEIGLYPLQDLLDNNKELECKIAHLIEVCTQKYKNNLINRTFEGYLYTAALRLFNNIAMRILEEATVKEHIENNTECFFSSLNYDYIEEQETINQKEQHHKWIQEFYGDDWTLEVFGRKT